MENLELLVRELVKLPNENECVEFKHKNFDPEMIGQDISALANSAAYKGKDKAYMVWGIHNETHDILGTKYNQYSKLQENQEIGLGLELFFPKMQIMTFMKQRLMEKRLLF